MARITLRQLLDHAAEHDYGVPAFNINNMEQALAIMDAASNLDAPVIIQASRGARSYSQDKFLYHLMLAATELYPEIIDGPDDNQPSCSAVDSILKQGLATNAMAASWIYSWLAEAFQHGSIGWSGLFFNLKTGRASSIPVSREAWDAIRPAATASEPVLKAA